MGIQWVYKGYTKGIQGVYQGIYKGCARVYKGYTRIYRVFSGHYKWSYLKYLPRGNSFFEGAMQCSAARR